MILYVRYLHHVTPPPCLFRRSPFWVLRSLSLRWKSFSSRMGPSSQTLRFLRTSLFVVLCSTTSIRMTNEPCGPKFAPKTRKFLHLAFRPRIRIPSWTRVYHREIPPMNCLSLETGRSRISVRGWWPFRMDSWAGARIGRRKSRRSFSWTNIARSSMAAKRRTSHATSRRSASQICASPLKPNPAPSTWWPKTTKINCFLWNNFKIKSNYFTKAKASEWILFLLNLC